MSWSQEQMRIGQEAQQRVQHGSWRDSGIPGMFPPWCRLVALQGEVGPAVAGRGWVSPGIPTAKELRIPNPSSLVETASWTDLTSLDFLLLDVCCACYFRWPNWSGKKDPLEQPFLQAGFTVASALLCRPCPGSQALAGGGPGLVLSLPMQTCFRAPPLVGVSETKGPPP